MLKNLFLICMSTFILYVPYLKAQDHQCEDLSLSNNYIVSSDLIQIRQLKNDHIRTCIVPNINDDNSFNLVCEYIIAHRIYHVSIDQVILLDDTIQKTSYSRISYTDCFNELENLESPNWIKKAHFQ